MAFGAKNIFPLDQRPSTAIGLALPFNSPSVFFQTYITKDAIKNNLLNFFLTNRTERYLNNIFGAGLREFIFEQIASDSISFLKENIQSLINQNFINIKIDKLDILQQPDTNEIKIILEYSIIGTGQEDQLQIIFS